MGGREGFRGYILQALVCVLSGLRSTNWDTISMEPDDKKSKVDIETWEGDKVNVWQVKSTENDFTKGAVIKILKDLIKDYPEANSFNLELLGNSTSGTQGYFKKLTSSDNKFIKEALNIEHLLAGKISIKFNTIDDDVIHQVGCSTLHKYLSAAGHHISFDQISLIIDGLTSKSARYAIKGAKIQRKEFEEKIVSWIDLPLQKTVIGDSGDLKLTFFDSKGMETNDQGSHTFNLKDVRDTSSIKAKILNLKNLHADIDKIKLPDRKSAQNDYKDAIKIMGVFPFLDYRVQGQTESASYSNEKIEELKNKAKNILNIEIQDSFFNLGRLDVAENRFYNPLHNNDRKIYIGLEEEKRKQELLSEFQYYLSELQDLLQSWDILQSYSFIPLVVENQGSDKHEDVELLISVDDTIDILLESNFPYPKYRDNIDLYSDENGILRNLLHITGNHKIKEYDFRQALYNFPTLRSTFSGEDYTKRKKELENIIKYELDYSDLGTISGTRTIKCTFRKFKPKDIMALPSYLMIKHDKSFEISYEIKSDRSFASGILNIEL